MSNSKLAGSILILSAALLAFIPGVAAGSPASVDKDEIVRVTHSDLDLSTDNGVRTLYARIRTASDLACGSRSSVSEAGSVKARMAYTKCYDRLVDKFVANADNAKLERLHAS